MSAPRLPDDPPSLASWLPPEREEDGPTALMMAYGYARNLRRHAEAWGPHLIAELLKAGVLEEEGDPVEAIRRLVSLARCETCRKVNCACTGTDP
jgi:hypothetical protein